MSSTVSGIPVVDFSSLSLNQADDELDETKIKITTNEMMSAFSTFGFVYLSNVNFPEHLVQLLCSTRPGTHCYHLAAAMRSVATVCVSVVFVYFRKP